MSLPFLTYLAQKFLAFVANLFSNKNYLAIVVGQGGDYEKTELYSADKLYRIVSVAVRNDKTGFVATFMPNNHRISNCKLTLEHKWADGSTHKLALIDASSSFTLLPGEEKYIRIASYQEAVQPTEKGGKEIRLMIKQGSFAYEHNPSSDARHVITLKAEASGNLTFEVNCFLYVDSSSGKLRLEKA